MLTNAWSREIKFGDDGLKVIRSILSVLKISPWITPAMDINHVLFVSSGNTFQQRRFLKKPSAHIEIFFFPLWHSGNEADWDPWGCRFDPCPCPVGQGSSCGVGCRHSSNPVLLWLWCGLATAALIRPLIWDLPYAEALKSPLQKKREIFFLKGWILWYTNLSQESQFLFLYLFFPFIGCPVACGVPGPGIRSELLQQQRWILNPLRQAGNWTCIPVLQRHSRSHCTRVGTTHWDDLRDKLMELLVVFMVRMLFSFWGSMEEISLRSSFEE